MLVELLRKWQFAAADIPLEKLMARSELRRYIINTPIAELTREINTITDLKTLRLIEGTFNINKVRYLVAARQLQLMQSDT